MSIHSAENLCGFLLQAAKIRPDRPAIVQRDERGGLSALTYSQLEELVRQYVTEIQQLDLEIGDRVVLEAEVSECAVAMLLACAALGLPFIPVSPETPAQRLLSIIGSAEPALFVQAISGIREGIPEQVATARFNRAGMRVERPAPPRIHHRRQVVNTDTAYIIFTSGTTGRPKGVVMSHRSVIALFRSVLEEQLITPQDRVATTSPLQFDLSLFDIGFALASGATLVPVTRADLSWPRGLVAFLREAEVTQVDGVPSIWRPVLRHEPDLLSGLSRIRGVLFTGEDFPLFELRQLQKLLPKARFINGYGATESMACSLAEVPNPLPEDVQRLSIGVPLAGFDVTLLDEDGRAVEKPGSEGQIYLRSPSLFTGYWDDPDATRTTLVPDPLDPRSGRLVLRSGDLAYWGADGELYFCGRVDSQVQIRGNRVELKEVERRLEEFPGVSAAVALLVPREGQDPVLNAYVVMSSDAKDGRTQLREFCKEALPTYMVPRGIFTVEEIPLTVNGKADRAALAASRGQ